MKLNFANIINDEATFLLYKHFGVDNELGYGVDGSLIASEIQYLNEYYPTLKNITIKINSMGGSVVDGLSVCAAILDSKIPVTTINKGMAYSIAGVVLVCGKKRKAESHSTFMMHGVSGGTDEKVLSMLDNCLAKIFENNSNISIDKCKSLMDKETWMEAEECKEMGIIDEIINTGNAKPSIKNKLQLHEFYNKFINKKQMIKLTNILKLSNEASEDAIIEKVQEIEKGKEDALKELEVLKEEKAAIEAKLQEFETAEIEKEKTEKEAVIENAVKDGKITAESKDKWINSAIKSNELKNLFESLKVTPTHVNVINAAKIAGEKNEKTEWTYSDWEKKDPAGLMEIKNNNPVEFERLVKTIK